MADGVASIDPIDLIDGWLVPSARRFSEDLMLGRATGLELGVHRGKFAACMARNMDFVVGVDALLDHEGQELDDQNTADAINIIQSNILSATGRSILLIRGRTEDLISRDLLTLAPAGFDFIHVDAGHEAEEVEFDLRLAESVLSPRGVIAADDVYSSHTPGVAEGFFRAMMDSALSVFAIGGNKVYLCPKSNHTELLEWAKPRGSSVKRILSTPAVLLD